MKLQKLQRARVEGGLDKLKKHTLIPSGSQPKVRAGVLQLAALARIAAALGVDNYCGAQVQ
ncbi:MAG: hypothetical protein ACI39C_14965 [Dietzia sp.]